MPENTGTQNYLQFTAAEQTRLNVVYVGSNDGFLHGFRAGSFDVNGNFVANGTTPNDGQEVLAYMPGSTLASAALPSAVGGCTNDANTQTLVQGIHGVTPAVGANPGMHRAGPRLCELAVRPQFLRGRDAGLGRLVLSAANGTPGSSAVSASAAPPSMRSTSRTRPAATSPKATPRASSSASGTAARSVCANVTNCGNNLGNTFGTPQIRRLHNGNWAVIFGNGFGSNSGDAGIYIMSIDSTSGAQTFYYLSTNTAGGNGIAYVTPADLDGDHITDYVYAGDLLGNVWRFDLTSNNPANWASRRERTPLFTTQSGQPITTQLLVISSNLTGGPPRVLIEFGTGQRTQLTNLAPVQYASGVQSLYGVWDWNLSAWNTLAPGAAYASLPATTAATGLASPYTLTYANLQAQTLTPNSNGRSGRRHQRRDLLAGQHDVHAANSIRLVRESSKQLGADHLQSGVLPGRVHRQFHGTREQRGDLLYEQPGYRLHLCARGRQRRRVHQYVPDLHEERNGGHRRASRRASRRTPRAACMSSTPPKARPTSFTRRFPALRARSSSTFHPTPRRSV